MKLTGYKLRKLNGGADRYGSFRDGKQITPDHVAGKVIYIPFTHLDK